MTTKQSFNHKFFSRQDPVSAYWLGYMLHRSVLHKCIDGKNYVLSLKLRGAREHEMGLARALGCMLQPEIQLSAPQLPNLLKAWGITEDGVTAATISDALLPHYLRGVVESLAHITQNPAYGAPVTLSLQEFNAISPWTFWFTHVLENKLHYGGPMLGVLLLDGTSAFIVPAIPNIRELGRVLRNNARPSLSRIWELAEIAHEEGPAFLNRIQRKQGE